MEREKGLAHVNILNIKRRDRGEGEAVQRIGNGNFESRNKEKEKM